MRLFFSLLAFLLSLSTSILFSAENNLLTNLELTITPTWANNSLAFMGELGSKNLRGNGTYGVYFSPCQRFKLSGEYLSQRLIYNFSSNSIKKWVSQYAVGAEYQYLISDNVFQSINLGGNYSHAFNHTNIFSMESLAGSNGYYGFLGTTLALWQCALLSGYADYDYVKYKEGDTDNPLAKGFGVSVNFVQRFAKDFTLKLLSEFRKPFNFYEGRFFWNHLFPHSGIECGLYANFTHGKKGLPNVLAGGFLLSISFGPTTATTCCKAIDQFSSPSPQRNCYSREYCNLANWTSEPAVYMPTVLNIEQE
jgi:hypothetical protein